MKAVIFKELGVIEVQDVPEPEPANDQIKVKIAYAGICGSDPIIVIGGLEEFPHQEGSIGWLQKPGPSRPGPKIMGHQDLARRVHDTLRLRAYSRTDFILSEDGPIILEVNTLPGMTETSLIPQQAAHIGFSYRDLVTAIIQASWDRQTE